MKRYVLILSGLLACTAAFAQNLNPTVEVTNAYQGKLMDVKRQEVPMAVPDSLLKFDWDFNYSVFDNPYKGAYEFTPYMIEMKPDVTPSDAKRFYARIGAGYSLHPEGVVYWNPRIGPKFTLSVYDRFKGYWGNYVDVNDRKNPYYGSDMANVAGLGARFNADKLVVSLDGDFDWIRTRELLFDGNNVLKGGGKIGIESVNTKHFFYGMSVHYYGLKNTVNDFFVNEEGDGPETSPAVFAEDNMGGDFKAGVRIGRKHSLAVDAKFDRYLFGDPVTKYASSNDVYSVTPSYSFIFKRGSVSLGATYADILKDKIYSASASEDVEYLVKNLYPDVHASFEVLRDALVVSAKFTGGLKFNTYGAYLEDNHHFNHLLSSRYVPGQSVDTGSALGQASVNTFDAALGLSGRITNRFQYKADAGFARWYHAPLDGVIESSGSHFYYLSMANYDIAYADIDAAFIGDRFNASAHFRFQDAALKSVSYALTLPHFVGDAMVEYNWNHRIFAGVNAEWMSVRRYGYGQMAIDPSFHYTAYGWLDLGVQLEYKFAGKFSVWAKGGNLLNQEVMRNCMYAEKGPYFTLGICTSL